MTLSGPGTVPFLEYHGARQTPERQMLEELDRHLEGRSLVVLYGHPCYEGVREQVLRKVFARVLERGFHFVTMQALAARLETASRLDDPSAQRLRHQAGGDQDGAGDPPPRGRARTASRASSASRPSTATCWTRCWTSSPSARSTTWRSMTPGQTPAGVAARVLDRLPPLLREIRPDVLLVQGDTMTTFAASFAAYLERIPSCHVEAGLRTGDRYQPFPEEMNRVLTTRLADLHFAPTTTARDRLLAEGVPAGHVLLTGNTVIDALLADRPPGLRLRDAGARRARPALAGSCW